MDFNNQIELEHLLFFDRKCRTCSKIKNLLDDFYLTRKDRKTLTSSYSYECKHCTIKRIKTKRKKNIIWEYPDW